MELTEGHLLLLQQRDACHTNLHAASCCDLGWATDKKLFSQEWVKEYIDSLAHGLQTTGQPDLYLCGGDGAEAGRKPV